MACLNFNQNLQGILKGKRGKEKKKKKKRHSEETKQVSRTDTDKTQMLNLLDQEFKITLTGMLIALIEK